MVLADALIDRVRVVEVVRRRDSEGGLRRGVGLAGERRGPDQLVDVVDEFLRAIRRNFLIVVPREERTAVLRIVRVENLAYTDELGGRLVGSGDDIEPRCRKTSE